MTFEQKIVLYSGPDEIQDIGYMEFTGTDPKDPSLRKTVTAALQYREGSIGLYPAIRWVCRSEGDKGNLILMPHLGGKMVGWIQTLTPTSSTIKALRNDCRRWLMRSGILQKERIEE